MTYREIILDKVQKIENLTEIECAIFRRHGYKHPPEGTEDFEELGRITNESTKLLKDVAPVIRQAEEHLEDDELKSLKDEVGVGGWHSRVWIYEVLN